jgi:hypothetical protein
MAMVRAAVDPDAEVNGSDMGADADAAGIGGARAEQGQCDDRGDKGFHG